MRDRWVVLVLVGLWCATAARAADFFHWDQSDVVVPSGVAFLVNFAVADDFTVPGTLGTYRLEIADLWMQDDMELPVDGTLTGFSGTVGWAIYGESFGEPSSTPIASGSDSTASLLGPTVPACCWDTQRVRFRFDPPVTVTSGKYWLAIREGAWGAAADATPLYASAAAQTRGSGAMIAPLGDVPASFSAGGGSDLAFALYGTAVPWSEEPYDSLVGSPVTSAVAANDFTLSEPFTPDRADVVLADGDPTPDGVVDSLGSTLGWGLYTDQSGMPGILLYSGTSGPPLTQTILGGNATIGDYASVRLDLSRVGTLAAGTYWLAIREGPWGTGAADATEVYWVIAERNGGHRHTSTSLVSPGGWSSPDSLDLAFSLSAADVVFVSGFEAGVTFAWTETVGGGAPP